MCSILGIDACISQNIAAVVPRRDLDSRYLYHVLKAAYLPLRELGRGGNQEALNCEIVSNFRIPVPPMDVQKQIADGLADTLARISPIFSYTLQQINSLKEYRTRLIADVVTGKLDVRKAAASLPDEPDEPDDLLLTDEMLEDAESAELPSEEMTAEEVVG
jgi:type I restriction enzyme S subunit